MCKRGKSQEDVTYPNSGYGSDEEMQFFDCEEGSTERTQLLKGNSSGGGGGGRYNNRTGSLDTSNHRAMGNLQIAIPGQGGGGGPSEFLLPGRTAQPHTPPELHRYYGNHDHKGTFAPPSSSGAKEGGGEGHEFGVQQASARDLAVNIVETIFVLAEFSYWKVRAYGEHVSCFVVPNVCLFVFISCYFHRCTRCTCTT